MILLPGGSFTMGSERDAFPFEGPEREVAVEPFLLDEHEVTVAEFERFVAATGHRTDSEIAGSSGVLDTRTGTWQAVEGADWRHPEGPGSAARADDPVVHVSWNDARAFCAWAGKRLPTEAEFEFAMRAGVSGATYPWGDGHDPGGPPRANLWQGTFPEEDLGRDGFRGVAPVGSFPRDRLGFLDLAGNVWEWCEDRFDPRSTGRNGERALRGGSWMCCETSCRGYRCAARSRASADSGLQHVGFRCAGDPWP